MESLRGSNPVVSRSKRYQLYVLQVCRHTGKLLLGGYELTLCLEGFGDCDAHTRGSPLLPTREVGFWHYWHPAGLGFLKFPSIGGHGVLCLLMFSDAVLEAPERSLTKVALALNRRSLGTLAYERNFLNP